MPKKPTMIHTVDRDTIFSSVIAVFQTTGVEDEFPLRIKFKGERGVDIGGVYRDMVSLFWKAAFEKVFDGGCLLTPVLHPDTDLSWLPVIGKIISHGYLSSGFLPVKMAFPTLASLLLQSSEIDDDILMSTFIHTVSAVEADTLSRAFVLSEFPADFQMQLSSILGRFGCRQLPTTSNLRQLVLQVARFEFVTKPSGAVQSISSGIPPSHRQFWKGLSVRHLHEEYLALSASPGKVLELLSRTEDSTDGDEGRVFEYLVQYIGQMRSDEVQRFLRFVTGSSVCSTDKIEVSFNKLKGMARRPIAHTCSSLLVLPSTYNSSEDLVREFRTILYGEEEMWKFDGV